MEESTTGRKIARIYCRIGSDQAQDGAGFIMQEQACIRYARSHGFVVDRVTKEVASEAALRDRSLLSHDLSEMRRHCFAALIAYSPDRLSRDAQQVEILARECEQEGVDLLFVRELLDTVGEDVSLQITCAQTKREHQTKRPRLGK